jgi:putative endonuclease
VVERSDKIGQVDGKMYYLYIIKSLRNKRYYVGSTNDVDRRLIEHNSGKSKYTRMTKPFELVYKEEYLTRSEAGRRELYIKKLKSKKYIEQLIEKGD